MPRRDAQGRDTSLKRERGGRDGGGGDRGASGGEGGGSHPHFLWPLTDRKRTQRKQRLIDRDIWGTWDSLVSPLLLGGQAWLWAAFSLEVGRYVQLYEAIRRFSEFIVHLYLTSSSLSLFPATSTQQICSTQSAPQPSEPGEPSDGNLNWQA